MGLDERTQGLTDDSKKEPDYLAGPRVLPDGRAIWVVPMTYGKGRIILSPDARSPYVEDCWCYETQVLALVAFEMWDGNGEPDGWIRHPFTGRRRPNGDKSKEYVMP